MTEEKSGDTSGRFATGTDARRGKGCRKGAPNAGRPPSVVAQACRLAFDQRIARLKRIADGKPITITRKVRRKDRAGVETFTEMDVEYTPTVVEQMKAMDMLARYGGMSSVQVTGEDGKPLAPGGGPTPEAILEKILAHAKGDAAAGA